MAKTTKTSVDINLSDLDQDDLRAYIRQNNYPGDVFSEGELESWAEDNGYTRDSER